jgi:hypothetical protein
MSGVLLFALSLGVLGGPLLGIVLEELVVDGIHQGLPAGLDDVVRNAHRGPALVLVAGLDEIGRASCRERVYVLV